MKEDAQMKRVGSLVLLLFNCLCLFTSPDIHAEVTTSGSLGRYMSIFDYSLLLILAVCLMAPCPQMR